MELLIVSEIVRLILGIGVLALSLRALHLMAIEPRRRRSVLLVRGLILWCAAGGARVLLDVVLVAAHLGLLSRAEVIELGSWAHQVASLMVLLVATVAAFSTLGGICRLYEDRRELQA